MPQQSKEAEKALKKIADHWESALEQRRRPYRHLGDECLEDFWDRSRDHYNGYVPERDGVEAEWKSRAFKKKTRHKVLSTVATIISSGIGLEFRALDSQSRLDRMMGRTVEDVFDWSLDREDFDSKELRAFMELVVSGTSHLFEEIVWESRNVKEITGMDFESGEVTWEEKELVDFKGCRAELVSNEEVYPGDVWTFEPQEQPFYIRRKVTTHENAEASLGKFANFSKVIEGTDHFLTAGSITESEKENADTDDNDVEILYYWNKSDDVFAIVANGILLTPPNYPIPYPHKKYPIAKGVFESFGDGRFYYGDSLPNKNLDEQNIVNELWRMFIDSTKLKIKPPLFTNNAELAGTDLIIPGAIATSEKGDEISTIQDVSKGLSQSEFNMLTLAERQIDENSIDPLLTGQQATGDPTATEVRTIVGSAERLRGFNDRLIASFLLQHAELRVPNLLWFITHDSEYQKIVKDEVKVGDKNGRRQIEFVTMGELPSSNEILQSEMALEDIGEPTELVFVDKDRVNDYRYHIRMSAVPKARRTGATKLLKTIEKYSLYSQNPLIDQKTNTTMLVEAMGDDPDEFIKNEQAQEMTQLPQQNQARSSAMAQQEQSLLG